jgi:6-pyruvoyltetrahydropterin/6-carboxytetrahydropterin synthase
MFEVGVLGQFEAAHRLRGDFGPAVRLHGHTYSVEVSVRGDSLRDDGTLCDIGLLHDALREAIKPLHYQDLDELPAFKGRNSTAETVAMVLQESMVPKLKDPRLHSLRVRVAESPHAYAAVEIELADRIR